MRPAPAVRRSAWPTLATLALAAAATSPTFAQPARPTSPNGRTDGFGYTVYDQSSGQCTFQLVDIASSGTPVVLLAPDALPGDPAPGDDGGAVIALALPFELYGQSTSQLVMSSNGYLAAAATLGAEDGRDFSNDAPIPAVPGYVPFASGSPANTSGARLAVYHDDLLARVTSSAQSQFFASCPRASEALGNEPCTVVQWTAWGLAQTPDSLTFQALLYHSSMQVAFQIGAGDGTAGAGATVGIQDAGALEGLQYAANQAGGVPGGTAACFFEPRYPSGGPLSDLEADIAGPPALPGPGGSFTFTVSAANIGPSPDTNVTLQLALPASVSYVSDTCGDALATGTYVLGDLAPQVLTSCDVTAQVTGANSGDIVLTIDGDGSDPEAANDTAAIPGPVPVALQSFAAE